MLRIGKLTDYATLIMTALAAAPELLFTTAALAERLGLELPTTAKVLKQLAQAGLVVSQRGAAGGYRLARAAGKITVADIVQAMEGPIGMTECSIHRGKCSIERHCGVRGNWRRISQLIRAALTNVTLAEMLEPRPVPARSGIPVRLEPC